MMKEVLNYTLDKYESVVIVTTKNGATRVIIKTDEEKALETEPSKPVLSKESLDESRLPVFEELRLLRRGLAEKEGVRPYLIFSDKALIDMALKLPLSKEEMMEVYGVGDTKYAKYGRMFIETIANEIGCVVEEESL